MKCRSFTGDSVLLRTFCSYFAGVIDAFSLLFHWKVREEPHMGANAILKVKIATAHMKLFLIRSLGNSSKDKKKMETKTQIPILTYLSKMYRENV